MTVHQIADALGIDSSSAGKHIKGLRGEGWHARTNNFDRPYVHSFEKTTAHPARVYKWGHSFDRKPKISTTRESQKRYYEKHRGKILAKRAKARNANTGPFAYLISRRT